MSQFAGYLRYPTHQITTIQMSETQIAVIHQVSVTRLDGSPARELPQRLRDVMKRRLADLELT